MNTKSVKQISLEEIYKIEPHYNKKIKQNSNGSGQK